MHHSCVFKLLCVFSRRFYLVTRLVFQTILNHVFAYYSVKDSCFVHVSIAFVGIDLTLAVSLIAWF